MKSFTKLGQSYEAIKQKNVTARETKWELLEKIRVLEDSNQTSKQVRLPPTQQTHSGRQTPFEFKEALRVLSFIGHVRTFSLQITLLQKAEGVMQSMTVLLFQRNQPSI